MNKYVNIVIEGEGQVGVIDLGAIDPSWISEDETKKIIQERFEPKLVNALEEHLSTPVKIHLIDSLNVIDFIGATVTVIVEHEDRAYELTVELVETWLY